MMIPTLILWSLTLAALSISIFALSVAYRSSARSLLKQHSALSMLQREQTEQLENLTLQLRNLRSRMNMQAYRARKRGKSEERDDEDDPGSERDSQLEWKRKMNLQLALRGGPK